MTWNFTDYQCGLRRALYTHSVRCCAVIEIEIDTTNTNINYTIIIANKKCKKKNSLTSIPIDEGKYHLVEIYYEKNQYHIFYEYTSVRPVYNKTLYINENTLNIDSIVKGYFNFEKADYDLENISINKNICNYNFHNFIKRRWL